MLFDANAQTEKCPDCGMKVRLVRKSPETNELVFVDHAIMNGLAIGQQCPGSRKPSTAVLAQNDTATDSSIAA